MSDLSLLDRGAAPQFPRVPAELLEEDPPLGVAAAFLVEVRAWRGQVIEWLGTTAASAYISGRLGGLLHWALGALPAAPEDVKPYRWRSFPKDALFADPEQAAGHGPKRVATEVLIWRARVQDFLADAWDTVGPDSFDPTDCANAETLFQPDQPGEFCFNCLQPLARSDQDAAQRHFASCVIRRSMVAEDKSAGAPWAVGDIWEKDQ